MRNTTLVLQGDSNQRLWWDTIHGFLPCSYVHKEGQWHAPRLCQNYNLSSTLIFCSHAMPFSPGIHTDLVTVSLPRALDKLLRHTPPGGKAVFVLHYYRHFTTYSLHVYRQRVREARRTLEQFVQLHPNVKVIIRAPHACYQSCHLGQTLIGDVVVAAYTEVWKEEFVGLEDKVWFLDLWDATVAAESVFIHPVPSVTKELLKVLFGYFCEGNM
ncbi:NXPE family member 3-like [Littorina saxatilis]|uniref:NXPE family member 3-like n=1 Tax=Littorina saxatilis TaxID=31220 RepID=UPI0038B427B0